MPALSGVWLELKVGLGMISSWVYQWAQRASLKETLRGKANALDNRMPLEQLLGDEGEAEDVEAWDWYDEDLYLNKLSGLKRAE